MKNSLLLLASLFFFPFYSHSQWNSREKIKGNGHVISKNITTSSYDKVLVNGFFDVDLQSGEEGTITIKGEENIIEFIEFTVENNALKIATEKGKYIVPSNGKKIQITVPFESISEVSLCGSGDINAKNKISTDNFLCELSGSGNINLTVDAKNIKASVSGSGDLTLTGESTNVQYKVTGSGDLNAAKLKSNNAEADVTGSGDCKVYCTDNLEARVTGSGDITYMGDPAKKDTKVTGSGEISKG
jgi:hypothetical protein